MRSGTDLEKLSATFVNTNLFDKLSVACPIARVRELHVLGTVVSYMRLMTRDR